MAGLSGEDFLIGLREILKPAMWSEAENEIFTLTESDKSAREQGFPENVPVKAGCDTVGKPLLLNLDQSPAKDQFFNIFQDSKPGKPHYIKEICDYIICIPFRDSCHVYFIELKTSERDAPKAIRQIENTSRVFDFIRSMNLSSLNNETCKITYRSVLIYSNGWKSGTRRQPSKDAFNQYLIKKSTDLGVISLAR